MSKKINDILPLHNSVLVRVPYGNGYGVKRVYRNRNGQLESHVDSIDGRALRALKSHGFQFVDETVWPWDDLGRIVGGNPSGKYFERYAELI